MKMNRIPVSELSGSQTFILICGALAIAIINDLIIVGICKLYDLISKRFEEWKKKKKLNSCEK